jgi:hypothetical protein
LTTASPDADSRRCKRKHGAFACWPGTGADSDPIFSVPPEIWATRPSGLYGLTKEVQNSYGIDKSFATGSSSTAITIQTFVAANYPHDLMQGPVPSSHPSHQLEIALGYYRGTRPSVNKAIGSKGGYDAMLKLRFQGESLGHYINYVESFQ